MKLKLYVLTDKNGYIAAISEYKSLIKRFMSQSTKEFYLEKITSEKKFNKYMMKYSEYQLIEFDKYVIREKERNYINEILNINHYQFRYTSRCISSILIDCNLTDKEYKILEKAAKIIKRKSKRKNIKDFMNIGRFICELYSSDHIQQMVDDLEYRNYL